MAGALEGDTFIGPEAEVMQIILYWCVNWVTSVKFDNFFEGSTGFQLLTKMENTDKKVI